jgi:hypothetical protein
VNEDKSKLVHPSLPRPEGEGWELGPDGDWWRPLPYGVWAREARWEPPSPEEMAAAAAFIGPPYKRVVTKEDLVKLARPNGEPPALAPYSAKPAKRTFIDFVAAEWMPVQDAFARMVAVLGNSHVAARYLRQDLRSGQLIAVVLWQTLKDEWEGCEQLAPDVWQAVHIRAHHWPEEVWVEIHPEPPWPKGWRGRLFRGHAIDFYIARAGLEKRYPLPEETRREPAPPTTAEPEPPTSQRKPGRHPGHDWPPIYAEITSRCYSSGKLVVPEIEYVLADEMVEWYASKGLHMARSTMREAVKKVCEHLRQKLADAEKTRSRKPSR